MNEDKAKRREKLKEDYIVITRKDYDTLTPKQQNKYDQIKERKNIPAFKKFTIGRKKGDRNKIIGLLEFDSETFKRIRTGPFRSKKKAIEKAKDQERYLEKGYLTDIGKQGPIPKPTEIIGVNKKKERLSLGGKIHRGRKAIYQ